MYIVNYGELFHCQLRKSKNLCKERKLYLMLNLTAFGKVKGQAKSEGKAVLKKYRRERRERQRRGRLE